MRGDIIAQWKAWFLTQIHGLRRSQAKTLLDLIIGLIRAERLGVASIGRGMSGPAAPKHCIKRVDRFLGNPRLNREAVAQDAIQVYCDWASLSPVIPIDPIGHDGKTLVAVPMRLGRAYRKRKRKPSSRSTRGRSNGVLFNDFGPYSRRRARPSCSPIADFAPGHSSPRGGNGSFASRGIGGLKRRTTTAVWMNTPRPGRDGAIGGHSDRQGRASSLAAGGWWPRGPKGNKDPGFSSRIVDT
ncbi:hypothetical protein TPY_3744 [Sulfobacillus acidophilus TPY]|uniref:Uncharacterized protein n=1 Tax=Sulfobacillus acidophilus (strain ATCC 700253 / DSM 10332 / NAL) TaxID=679936 RepID=G8TUB5_SULAD|nr:hypothetical protein TPY_3744 [Sulfobacillus acidophilus TPY]AEW06877.1 hypothetical protein Sulac_3439 [Sulfobacillus acidophilus DSM 10332]